MTTPRTHRTKPQQAVDLWKSFLRDQEAKAQRLLDAYNVAEAEVAKTRRVLELFDEPASGPGIVLPGIEPTREDADVGTAPKGKRCAECKGELPWHYEECPLLASTKGVI